MEILRAAARHKGSLAVKHTTGGSCRLVYLQMPSTTYSCHCCYCCCPAVCSSTFYTPTSACLAVCCNCSFGKLLDSSATVKAELQRVLPAAGKPPASQDGPRVGIYAEPGMQYVAATWATWMAGGVAVPLAVSHPPHELDYVIRDAGISAVRAAT
jgi:acyl-CoA synthetase (AMP-forming)/AMP-acid ligase II